MSTGQPASGVTETEVPHRPLRRRGWRRLLNVVLGLAIVVTLAAGVLRVTSLWGLPDAPEPFDAAAYATEAIPDDRNAVVLFAAGRDMLGGERELAVFQGMWRQPRNYVEEKPEALAWVEDHRAAMEVWRRGTERPDAMPIDKRVPRWSDVLPDQYFGSWLRVAGLEASRLEHLGDLEGAWRWHKARLRATLLMGRRRGIHTRHFLAETFSDVSRRATDWAKEPKATVPLLRRAIADVEAMAGLHGTEAESLKTDYLALMADFDDFADPRPGRPDLVMRVSALPRSAFASPAAGLTSRVIPPEMLRPLEQVASFIEAEPERSRRITRMIFVNWLAQADKKPADRPATASAYPLVFDEDAGATPSLPTATLARRAATAPYFAIARGGFAPPPAWWYWVDQWPTAYRADRQTSPDLILSLADRIYEIENRKPPANVEGAHRHGPAEAARRLRHLRRAVAVAPGVPDRRPLPDRRHLPCGSPSPRRPSPSCSSWPARSGPASGTRTPSPPRRKARSPMSSTSSSAGSRGTRRSTTRSA